MSSYISPSNLYFIAPFAHDISTRVNGNVYYRLINDTQTLNQIGLEISSLYYLNTLNFIPSNAFIVTWDTIAAYDLLISGYVSFQIILSNDNSKSFLTVNYGTLDFTASDGYYFQYGYYYPGFYTTIGNSNPDFSSNVNVNGKYIYHLSILLFL
jgi:hypothetical protein